MLSESSQSSTSSSSSSSSSSDTVSAPMAVELSQEQSDAADATYTPPSKRKSSKRKSGVTQDPLCTPLSTFRRYLKKKFPGKGHLKISKDALNLMARIHQQRMMNLLTQSYNLQKHTGKETLQTHHVVKAFQLISQGSAFTELASASVAKPSSVPETAV